MSATLLTFVLTVAGGVLIFVVGQTFLKFVIEPIHELRKLIGRIAFSLIYYDKIYGNPGFAEDKVLLATSKTLRDLACELRAAHHAVPWRNLWGFLRPIPRSGNVLTASKRLMYLSNNVDCDETHRHVQAERNDQARGEVEKLLRIV